MRYACLVYHDPTKLAELPEAEKIAAIVAECEAAAAWRAEMQRGGHLVLSAGLQSPTTATTVRKSDGQLAMTDGPFAESKEFLGGFTIIEARDLNEALQLAAKLASPLVTVEVRPILDANAVLSDELDQKIAASVCPRPSFAG